ncbi:hypothetical protein COV58_04600 [Candidatus Roizmanbacteria bacterium CG11_big_fil_rev_8_21_14_0_20_36_8]|nr:MAG: hypothetical protein COV58_04600 [Candidatus Roizmanbacteria bacterium CG11_big_fil_rev_8_21_14_0_20_36_8]
MKNPMNVENVLKFFENNYGAKFIDINTKKPVLEIIAKNKTEEKSEFDLWLEQQDEETQSAHKMGEI